MLIKGTQIRDEIKESLKKGFSKMNHKPKMVIVSIGEDEVKEKFTKLKKKFGEDIGVEVVIKTFKSQISEDELENEVKKISEDVDAVVIQLPLPQNINIERILNAVPEEKDIDMLSKSSFESFLNKKTKRMPPVVGAISEILDRYKIDLKNKKIVIVGKGKLVGKPIFLWMMSKEVLPTILDKNDSLIKHTKDADIIISGAGSPGIIKPDMIKDGVVLIDVGTSSDSGVLKGDIDPKCRDKASLFSSVPGGVGPITVAKLFQNILY